MFVRITGLSPDVNIINEAIWDIVISKIPELKVVTFEVQSVNSPFGMGEQVKISNNNEVNIQGESFNVIINNDGLHFNANQLNEISIKYIITRLEDAGFFTRYGIEYSYDDFEELNNLKGFESYNGEIKKNRQLMFSEKTFFKFEGYRFSKNKIQKFVEINSPTNIKAQNMFSENIDEILGELANG